MPGKQVLLQSGFSSVLTDALVQEEKLEKSFVDQLVQKSIFQKDAIGYYDKEIRAIYQTMVDNTNSLSEFDFRERVLVKAITVFSDERNSIVGWFRTQDAAPTVGYLHEQFLLETLDVVNNNAVRKMSLSTYRRLLHAATHADTHEAADKGKENRYITLKDAVSQMKDVSVPDFLAKWTSTVAGMQDLVMTMDVLLGHRPTPGL